MIAVGIALESPSRAEAAPRSPWTWCAIDGELEYGRAMTHPFLLEFEHSFRWCGREGRLPQSTGGLQRVRFLRDKDRASWSVVCDFAGGEVRVTDIGCAGANVREAAGRCVDGVVRDATGRVLIGTEDWRHLAADFAVRSGDPTDDRVR